jgi:leucyl/phenylalanyl-tRNA--protein transferase
MTRLRIPKLPDDPRSPFPDPRKALRNPDGLLAFGGDLAPIRLLNAYAHGIFPWYSEGEPILWWSPDPRMVFRCDGVHLSRRFRQQVRKRDWTIRADTAFERVILDCANSPRAGQSGTWITAAMRAAYGELHRLGHAHAIEVWGSSALVGGLYGVAMGKMFFAESMFSAVSGGSKVALAALAGILREWGWPLFDAQVESEHLLRMGATTLPRDAFLDIVARQTALTVDAGPWTESIGERGMDWLLAATLSPD